MEVQVLSFALLEALGTLEFFEGFFFGFAAGVSPEFDGCPPKASSAASAARYVGRR